MDLLRTGAAVLGVVLVAAGCDTPGAVAPTSAASTIRTETGGENRVTWVHGNGPIILRDQCDPATFNSVFGSGDCIAVPTVGRRVPYQDFLGQLEANHNVRGWWINPTLLATASSVLALLNTGGEAHAFTEVSRFGGGIVPALNELAGTPVLAPECALITPEILPFLLVRPGSSESLFLPQEPAVLKFQCCIHPWMRMEIETLG